MTVTITLNTMIDGDADERLIYEVEGLVGSRETYGLNTPISIITILDNLGIEFAITCLDYAVEDIRAAAQNIALDWIEANREPWDYATNSNPRVKELAFQAALYMQTTQENQTPRLNYCGELLDNGQPVTSDALNGLADNLTDYSKTLDFVGTPQVYYHVVAKVSEFTESAKMRLLYGPTLDVDNLRYLPRINQTDDLITDLLTDPTKVSFLENSLQIEEDTRNATFEGKTFYVGIGYSFWDSRSPLRNELNEAAYGIAQATVVATRMIANNSNYLTSVYQSIVGAYASYREGRLREVNRVYARVNTLSETGMLPLSDDRWDAAIRDAGSAAKAAALQDYDWVKQFDVNDNERISSAERGQMELAARRVAIDARKARATELAAEIETQLDLFLSLEPFEIESIFRLYFS